MIETLKRNPAACAYLARMWWRVALVAPFLFCAAALGMAVHP